MAAIANLPQQVPKNSGKSETLKRNEKGTDVRRQNIMAAKAIADLIRTSLGPRGMDKMIQGCKDDVIISNDGATILKEIRVMHPAAKMLVDLAKAQDIEAGDGTTSVVVLAGALLEAAEQLLNKGVHPQVISSAFWASAAEAEKILKDMAIEIASDDKESLIKAAKTALESKVVSQNSELLAPMAVDAVAKVMDAALPENVDLKNIRVVKKLGGTVEETELVDGLVFTQQRVSRTAGGPASVKDAKIGLIQFCLSPPKTDMDNNITIKDYQAMDRLLREERLITANMVKKIAATGCNVLLIQKSILRDATTDLSLDFLAKKKILVIKDIEREDIAFISKTIGCEPVASLDHFTSDKLGTAGSVISEAGIVKITGVPGKNTVTALIRGSNNLILDETERSFHDALCVVRSLVKLRALVPGGGAPEMEVAVKLYTFSNNEEIRSVRHCVTKYADALAVIPSTLSENAGLNPVKVVTELREKHVQGQRYAGVNVKKGIVTDMWAEQVTQPLLVTLSAIKSATEVVMMILKIDDVVLCR